MRFLARIYAKDLRAGDVCAGSQQTVLWVGLREGKRVPLELRTRDGATRRASWNAYTRLGVLREVGA